MWATVGDIFGKGQWIFEVNIGNWVDCEDQGFVGRHPGDSVSDLPFESHNFSREGCSFERGKVGSPIVGVCKPKPWCFVKYRGGYMTREAVQGDGSTIIHAMSIGGGPADHLPPIVFPSVVVVGGAMSLAGTKYICHVNVLSAQSNLQAATQLI